MGLHIHQEDFCETDRTRYQQRLLEQLVALEKLLLRRGFGVGPRTIGAELEMFLVDDRGSPLRVNQRVMDDTSDDRITLEMAQFNIESNARPLPLGGRCLSKLEAELRDTVDRVRAAAAENGARVVLVGMLPTLKGDELLQDSFSDAPRYRALSRELRRLRANRPVRIHIEGEETLQAEWDDVSIQGANTSFQLHLRVNPAHFAAAFNAAQIATAPALAASVNSPILMGWKLWDETRIPLLEQALDGRSDEDQLRPSRSSFGNGWVRRGAYECFAEVVALHRPVLPVCTDEDVEAVLREGGVPKLEELKLHNGTIWRWNRAVYDDAGGGHVRVELRALPAGPTIPDMVANAAFLLGLTLSLIDEMEDVLPLMPFAIAEHNFYAAARSGLDAELYWPTFDGRSPKKLGARELLLELIPLAHEGLLAAGVDPSDAERWMAIFRGRVERGITGAKWQKEMVSKLEERGLSRTEAIAEMFARYRVLSDSGMALYEWPLEEEHASAPLMATS